MSKLMGKIILGFQENDKKPVVWRHGLSVRYLRCSDSFEFRGLRLSKEEQDRELKEIGSSLAEIGCGTERARYRLVVKSDVLSAMIMADKIDDVIYHWSVGYESREKLGRRAGDYGLLKSREIDFIRKVLSASDSQSDLLDLDGYLDLCVWQYLFNISETVLLGVKRCWKRKSWGRSDSSWVSLGVRKNFGGRKRGANSIRRSSDLVEAETEEEFVQRISHNKKVALERGIMAWYLEACLEECKRRHVPFSRPNSITEWNELRALRENVSDF